MLDIVAFQNNAGFNLKHLVRNLRIKFEITMCLFFVFEEMQKIVLLKLSKFNIIITLRTA
jgi:hypothetical protein